MEEAKKKCTGPCGRVLPATREHFTSARTKSGLSSECLACIQVRARANRLKRLARESGVPLPVNINQGEDAPTRKTCIKCHHSYPATAEHFDLDDPVRTHKGRNGRECIKCKNLAKKIKETCAACGTNNGNMRGDVDLATGHRYGILCSKCNTLVAASKGDAERMSKVARYLRRTRKDSPSRADETGHQLSGTEEVYPKEKIHDREEK